MTRVSNEWVYEYHPRKGETVILNDEEYQVLDVVHEVGTGNPATKIILKKPEKYSGGSGPFG